MKWKEDDIQEHIKDQERFTGADKKLKELGNLKGKISNKASTVKKNISSSQRIQCVLLAHRILVKS